MKKIKINGKEYTLDHREWNAERECYYYYVTEIDGYFCDLDDDIEEVD